jgi:hypothetical protein
MALGLAACAREPGLPEAESRTPVNWRDLEPNVRCIDQCQPDYGSGPVDCATAEAGLEFFPVPVWDFEGTARALYGYTDKTSDFIATTDVERRNPETDEIEIVGCPLGEVADCSPYEPATARIQRCGQETGALHVRGGPYREWGAGIGRRLVAFATQAGCPPMPQDPPASNTPSYCPKLDPAMESAPGRALANGALTTEVINANGTPREEYYDMQIDLREWEGISFWARRGPDSQAGFRVALGDRNTDDDIAFLEYEVGLTPRCGRQQECGGGARLADGSPDPQSQCRSKDLFCLPIYPGRPNDTWCWNPNYQVIPENAMDEELDVLFDRCGHWACDRAYPAFGRPDLLFITPDAPASNPGFPDHQGTNTCARHTFGNDQVGEYCFNPSVAPPAEGPERCGDNYMDPVTLGPDWQFYKVPFSELRQEGWAKRFPALDLSRVTVVRFTWTVGWVDYWIDDVRFYRSLK